MKQNLQIILTLGLITATGRIIAGGITNPAAEGEGRPVYIRSDKIMAGGITNLVVNGRTIGRIAASGINPAVVAKLADTNAMPAPETLGKTAPAQEPQAEPAPMKPDEKGDFKAFQTIIDKNIFDMTRTGAPRSRRTPVHVPKVDDFTLYGTSSYEKGEYAFFDGSSPAYRQICKLGGSIAGYKVAAIGSDYVELQGTNGSKTVKMDIGTTIRREDNGPWSAPSVRGDASLADSGGGSRDRDSSDPSDRGGRGERRDRRSRGDRGGSSDSGATSSSDQSSGSSPSVSNQDEIIKRMMERRAKEVKDDQ